MLDQVYDEIAISMEEKVNSLSNGYSSKCCINKIPAFIRKGSEECYQPSVVSIGPIYYDHPSLKTIQDLKWIYLKNFLQHPSNDNPSLKDYTKFVRDHESAIYECFDLHNVGGKHDNNVEVTVHDPYRKCYEQHIVEQIRPDKFIEMMVLDAAFIVYLFISNSDLDSSTISIPKSQQGLVPYLVKDLFLLENQLPFFVIQGFFDIAFGNPNDPPSKFIHIILNNLISITSFPGYKVMKRVVDNKEIIDASTTMHLLDLLRKCCCLHSNLSPINRESRKDKCYPRTAKKLSDNGVKFEVRESECPLHITFKKGKLMIPEFVLDTDTEPYLRNLLYFEKCHYSEEDYINDNLLFLDKLIDTIEDVEVLQEAGILLNHLGSDEDAIKFFNNVPRNTTVGSHFHYSQVSKDANEYASDCWNQSKAILRNKYFHHPWAIISVIAAIILFILSLLQTISGFTK
ncbi:UPF0481 protein At3g47200-like [Chenopodium quinoa]|uniref:UPF0481 protein At3g47200-like n=1 Tax=Chenopodium quinoa TaxID=63459 RepID=UPI000B790C4D|nr:UPF0481 protein At3g47200-like [Chenopodium quinoa]